MDHLMTRRSRKRGCPSEKRTEDVHQDLGEPNKEDTVVPCLQSSEEEGDKKCIEPLESLSITNGNTNEKNGESETPNVTTPGLKRQLVISLSDCGHKRTQNKMEEQEKVPNKCEPLDDSNKYIDVKAEIKPSGSEEQMSAEDNHKMETNQVKQISFEPVVEGSVKKRRRMGMCRLSEKERSLFLPKCGNRAEKNDTRNENTVLSPQQQTTESMQHLKTESHQNNRDDREETKIETEGTTMVFEPQSTVMHISEDDNKGGLHSEVITKDHTHEKKGLQRTKPGCQMTAVGVPMCESSLIGCKSERTKDSYQSLENHHCAEEELTRGRIESKDKTLDNLCKDHTEPNLIQASDQQPETEHQQNQTETEVHLTVSVCDASSLNLENWETAQKLHLDKMQHLNSRSETEVHLTATLSNDFDSVCEPQNPEVQTTKVHLDGPPEPAETAALLNKKMQMNEQEEPQKEVEATFTKLLQQHENKYADGDHNHGENCNIKINSTEDAPIEQKSLHEPDIYDKTSLKNLPQVKGENPHIIYTSVSNDALETICCSMDNIHMMNNNCEEKEPYDANSSAANMGPPESREYVSDSQLNTIDMTDQVMDDGTGVSPECYEDATDLVSGLIRELSSLNRTVMVTHRELENLRRKGKNSRNTSR